MKKLVLIGALLLSSATVLLAGSVQGNHKHPSPEKVMKKLDANNDGKISKEEAKGRLLEHFSKVDGDADGYVTLEELKAIPRPERERGEKRDPKKVFKHLDTNGDELISKKEAKGPLRKHFDRVDANKDGSISKAELENAPKPKEKDCEKGKDCKKSCKDKANQ